MASSKKNDSSFASVLNADTAQLNSYDSNNDRSRSSSDKNTKFTNITLSDSTKDAKDTSKMNDIVPVPPDGGYGWMIVFAAFACSFVVDGISTAFAPLLDEYVKRFNASVAIVGMIGSSLIGSYLVVGPLVSGLVNRYGVRKIAIIGSITAGIGFLTSIFAIDPLTMILSYGIVAGVGLGFIYLPAMVIVCFYFEKKRAVAVGLAVAGSGVGTIVMPPLNKIGCEGTLVVLAALGFLCVLFSYLFKPLKSNAPMPLKEVHEVSKVNSGKQNQTKQAVNEALLKQKEFVLKKIIGAQINTNRSRAASESSNLSQNYFQSRRKVADKELISKSFSYGMGQRRRISAMEYARESTKTTSPYDDPICSNLIDFAKPMSRSDIFYQGSIKNIPEFVEEGLSYTKYRAKYITIPAPSDDFVCNTGSKSEVTYDQKSICTKGCKCIPTLVKVISSEMININLLEEPAMILLCLSNIFAMLGFYIPFMFLGSMAREKGVESRNCEWLLSALGISNTIGRVAFGWLADQGVFSPLTLNNLSLLFSGLLTLLCPFYVTAYSVMIYSVLYGFVVSAFICLTTINVTNLLGLDRLTSAFGMVIVSRSIASFLGTPLAGTFYGFTKSYDASFWFAGTLIILGGISTLLIPFFKRSKDSLEGNETGKF